MTADMNGTPLSSVERKQSLRLVCAGLALVLASSFAAGAEKKEEISRSIAKEMTAAQKALQAGQLEEALKQLSAAEQKGGLSPYDKKIIAQDEAYAYIKTNRYKDAQVALEKEMESGAATADEKEKALKSLFTIAASTQQYQKAIDYGKQLVDAGIATPDQVSIIAQSYYLLKDCKDAVLWSDKAIAAERKAGEVPKENNFLFKLQCASDSGDQQAMVPVLQELIRLNGKTQWWNDLLRIELQGERDDHNTLMILRLMYATNSMTDDGNLIEMVQLLADAGLPGEAYSVLNKAVTSGLPMPIKPEHKERTARLLNALKTRADADQKSLPQQDAEAAKSSSGEASVKLGEVYYGFGDYKKAADAIHQGLQKGNIKHLDEAYIYLALSDVQIKDFADAKKALASLKTVPNISARVDRIWELYGATLGSGSAAANGSEKSTTRTAQLKHRSVHR